MGASSHHAVQHTRFRISIKHSHVHLEVKAPPQSHRDTAIHTIREPIAHCTLPRSVSDSTGPTMVQASRAHGQSQSLSPRTLHGTPRLVQHPAPSPCVLGEHKLGCAAGSELCVTIDACKADPDVCALRVELFTGTVCLE